MFQQVIKCTDTFPTLREAKIKETAGMHSKNLAVTFNEENAT